MSSTPLQTTRAASDQPKRVVIGIDVGGTKTTAALIDESGQVMESHTEATRLSSDAAILEQIERLSVVLLSNRAAKLHCEGIGIGLPGVIDSQRGIARLAANLPWNNTHIVAQLTKALDQPIHIDNDANAGALGEKWFGKGRQLSDFVYLCIGTGIGSGIVIDNQLLRTRTGLGSEVGHMIILPEGPLCRCGSRGCLEAVAAGPAIARRMQERSPGSTQGVTAQAVIKAAQDNDQHARAILEEVAQFLALGIANIWRLLGPEKIILGGGVASAGRLILEPLRISLRHLLPQRPLANNYVAVSNLRGNSGVLGAAALALANAPHPFNVAQPVLAGGQS